MIIRTPGDVPDPPTDLHWRECLRWILTVMDDDDKSMSFVAGCLSQGIHKNGLSSRQLAGCNKVFERIRHDWEHLQLDCQQDAVDG